MQFRATMQNCTCCVIKPHAVIEGNVGAILEHIAKTKNFYISAIAMFSVDVANAQEFNEIYKGVLPEYEVNIIKHCNRSCHKIETSFK